MVREGSVKERCTEGCRGGGGWGVVWWVGRLVGRCGRQIALVGRYGGRQVWR